MLWLWWFFTGVFLLLLGSVVAPLVIKGFGKVGDAIGAGLVGIFYGS